MHPLDPIITYQMDALESKAYKLCLMWDDLIQKEFPGEWSTRLRSKGDPRKSTLFKYCYKLARETKGLIPDKDYKLYITAQLHILRIQNDGNVHALVDPCVLVGDKAWHRWKVWKKYYDKRLVEHKTSEELEIKQKIPQIKVELDMTKKFLVSEEIVTFEKVQEKIADASMIRWITTGKVSPYYAILSPFIFKAFGDNLEKDCMFDFSSYRKDINSEVEAYFKQEFCHEF